LVEPSTTPRASRFADPKKLAYIRRRRSRSDDTIGSSTCCAAASRPITGPHKEDICYATTNRQARVKTIAEPLRLNAGDRRTHPPTRAAWSEVAKSSAVPMRTWCSARANRLELATDSRTVGVTAGASAPGFWLQQVIDE